MFILFVDCLSFQEYCIMQLFVPLRMKGNFSEFTHMLHPDAGKQF